MSKKKSVCEVKKETKIDVVEPKHEHENEKKDVVDECVYPTELLIKSDKLKHYRLHIDVLRAILVKDEYSVSNAEKSINKYIESFN